MDHDYTKWDKYEIGKVPWVNLRKSHLSKLKYIEYIIGSDFKNVLEIGAAEAIEAQEIRKHRDDINYTLLDVSDTFLEYVKSIGFNTIKGEMHNTGAKDKEFDLVYLASVLEHSPDLNKTFEELQRISKSFYFTMFKWRMKGKRLRSNYIERRKYFSSEFSINILLKLIRNYGDIEQLFICTESGKYIEYDEYLKGLGNIDKHRNGNYLSILGKFKEV